MRSHAGFTLTETLIAVAVGALLLRLATPVLAGIISYNQRVAATNTLVGSIQYARSEAHTRATEVVLCPSQDGQQCAGGAPLWQHGWLVFADATPTTPRRLDASDELLLVRQAQPGVTIHSNRPAFAMRPFRRRSTNGTLVICPRHAATLPRVLIVSFTGRPRRSDVLADGGSPTCPAAR